MNLSCVRSPLSKDWRFSKTDQKFGCAKTGLRNSQFDGVFGVSYALSAQIDKTTVIDRLYQQGQIKNVYSALS